MKKAYVSPEIASEAFLPYEDILNGSSVVIDAGEFFNPDIEV